MAIINYNSTDAELHTKVGCVDTRANLPEDAKFGDRYDILSDSENDNKFSKVVRGVSAWVTIYKAD